MVVVSSVAQINVMEDQAGQEDGTRVRFKRGLCDKREEIVQTRMTEKDSCV